MNGAVDGAARLLLDATTLLLVPALAALLLAVGWSLLQTGAALREWRERRRAAVWPAALARGEPAALATFFAGQHPGFLGRFAARGRALRGEILLLEKLAADLEIEADHALGRVNLGARLAPMLGLVGTLIPLGPALVGLSRGELEVLVQDLVVAFTTTVLGLFAGGLCCAIALCRRRWYAQDLADLELVLRALRAEAARD
ncbi:MAG: MotA/TolQ/ExbB proton channel family protein [Planctomycetota bacterium]